MARVVVYGSSGAGKSTFASDLATRCHATHIEIDLLAFDVEGNHVGHDVLRTRFVDAIATEHWIVEGMNRDQLNQALQFADAFVWLDFSRLIVARRLLRRVVGQLALGRERHGRKTTLRSTIDRELPFVWKSLRGWRRRRAHGERLAALAASLGCRVDRASSPRSADRLVRALAAELCTH